MLRIQSALSLPGLVQSIEQSGGQAEVRLNKGPQTKYGYVYNNIIHPYKPYKSVAYVANNMHTRWSWTE